MREQELLLQAEIVDRVDPAARKYTIFALSQKNLCQITALGENWKKSAHQEIVNKQSWPPLRICTMEGR